MTKAEKLIETITTNPDSMSDGILANELLREFYRGFPVQNLIPLLRSRNEKIVGTASFITNELGGRAAPLLATIAKLLNHPNRHVRADAIGSILTCTTGHDQSEIAAVISMLDDFDWPIRWKAMEFLSLASTDQLGAALQFFEKNASFSDHVSGLRWLRSESTFNLDEISSWLNSSSGLQRKYAVVAAARIALIPNKALNLASSSEDADVKQFADSILKMRA